MKAGNKIRVFETMMGHVIGTNDFIVEEFRYCLGIFESEQHREIQRFTPLCEMYEPAADSKKMYMSDMGEYQSKYVQYWMDLPKD